MIEIVRAEERHILDICNLWLEFMQYSADIDSFFTLRDGSTSGFEKEYLRPAMESENSLVFVALDAEKVVGYSHAQVQDIPNNKLRMIGHIQHLFITKSYRRQGIGEKMYAEILKWFHSKGIDRVELQVIVKNQIAYSFWRKHGYMDFQNTLYRQL
jgi:ribosomal protein S18 acetylase RimI-like enzyme